MIINSIPSKAWFSNIGYICLKKKSASSFDSCYRKLLVKSKAQQSRLCMYVKVFPERAPQHRIATDRRCWGWSLDRPSCEAGDQEVKVLSHKWGLLLRYSQDCSSRCCLCSLTWLIFFKNKAVSWYFLHYIAYWQTLDLFNSAENNLAILNWLKNLLLVQNADFQILTWFSLCIWHCNVIDCLRVYTYVILILLVYV